MNPEEIALPWFPITPDYIDQYHESVLKYLRDVLNDRSQDTSDDSSYLTTVSLLLQRAEQIASDISSLSLQQAEQIVRKDIEKDIKILAAAAFICSDDPRRRKRYMVILTFLIALLKPEISDMLVPLFVRFMKSESIDDVGFTIDAIIDMDVLTFVKSLRTATTKDCSKEWWFENHGTVRIDKDSISLYDLNRYFLGMKMKNGTGFRPTLSAEDGTIAVLQDKRDRKGFTVNSFLNTVAEIMPEEPEEEKKKVYADGDVLTVKILNKAYDTLFAESTDPAYETVAGPIVIMTASNIRGIYMTDITRNISLGSTINVTYHSDERCFSLDETVLDFIRKTYWEDDEESQHYARMDAMLLFPFRNNVKNTWLTEHGFLVRTEYESLPRYTYRTLDILNYDDDLDFFVAAVSDDEPDTKFDEKAVKDSFIRLLLYTNRTIASPAPPKKEIRFMDKELISLLHRILAIKQDRALDGSEKKENYIGVCCALAAIADDEEDLWYYSLTRSYLQSLIAFAKKEFPAIQSIDTGDSKDYGILQKSTMLSVLKEYDNPEESEVLIQVISQLQDTDIADVAKLVQASNRFIGSSSLERLRDDLHREICTILNITDAIVIKPDGKDDSFPFPGEDDRTEHKASWIYDNETSEPNETSQSFKILKTICAFMNRYPEQGESHLYIGTDEKRHYVCGIQQDIDFLTTKEVLTTTGADKNDEYCRHIMAAIKRRFPESYQYVSPHFCEGGKVLDLVVTPAIQGIVYLEGIPYYRYASNSIRMPDNIRQEILDRKYLRHSDMVDKIDAINKAIQTGRCVVLKAYDSSNSNTTGNNRSVEAFAFVDNGRYDAIWAYDYSSTEKKNKVFLLKRATAVEILERPWQHTRQHQSFELDMFGFYGADRYNLDMEIRSTRAKNLLVEQFPDVREHLEILPEGRWRVRGTLFNQLSLAAACSFYLSVADDVDISSSPALVKYVSERLTSLIEKIC